MLEIDFDREFGEYLSETEHPSVVLNRLICSVWNSADREQQAIWKIEDAPQWYYYDQAQRLQYQLYNQLTVGGAFPLPETFCETYNVPGDYV